MLQTWARRATHPALTQGECPLLRPLCPGNPEQQRQSLGRSPRSASQPMTDQHRDPTTPGSWVLPQRQVEGGTEQARHVSQLSPGGGGAGGNKSRAGTPSRKGAGPGGKAAWTGWRVWGCRLTLAVRPAQLLQAITAAPPSAPNRAPAGEGTHHGICCALTGSTCLAPLRNKTLMAASPGGC